MAAGEVGRDLAYFTFGDVQLKDELAATHAFLVENEVTIGKKTCFCSLVKEYISFKP